MVTVQGSMTNVSVARRLARAAGLFAVAVTAVVVVPTPLPVFATVIEVTSVDYANHTDGLCGLDEAVANANNDASTYDECGAGDGADTIVFDLPGSAPYLFQMGGGGLPQVTDTLTIDGTSQAGYTPGVPVIQIDHTDVPAFHIIDLSTSTNSVVKGLMLTSAGSFQSGVRVGPGSVVESNWIGVGPTGEAFGSNGYGVLNEGFDDVVIGGDGIGRGNVISGNDIGIAIAGPAENTRIVNNIIGLDPNGATAVPNGFGIVAGTEDGPITGLRIGDTGNFKTNVISGNTQQGVRLLTGVVAPIVVNNRIGVGSDGFTPFGNGTTGIELANVDEARIGDIGFGNTNIIANNGEAAVSIRSGERNRVVRNDIYANGSGIDLDDDGPTPNDPLDADSGANRRQNFPTILSAVMAAPESTSVVVSVDSAITNAEYPIRIDLYRSAAGQGRNPAGSTTIAAPGIVTIGTDIEAGSAVVATATDALGNTSEFSAPLTVQGLNDLVVDSAGDAPDADIEDGECSTSTGTCTLRAAIQEAEANTVADTITFDIPGTGPIDIVPQSSLPFITSDITIDGLSQPGTSCATWPPVLRVRIDTTITAFSGFTVAEGRLTLRGIVLNGNPLANLVYLESTSSGSQFQCNFFGTDVTGTQSVGRRQAAIWDNGSSSNVIGGPNVSDRNLFAGESDEQIRMGGNDNVVQGNYFGTDVTGTSPLGSPDFSVIAIAGQRNLIGGPTPAHGNLISSPDVFAAIDIWANGATGNTVRQNRITGNGGLGINLGNDLAVVTFNHVGAATGPNEFQNYPVLTVATSSPSATRVVGTLDSLASRSYTIDVYANPVCDESGFGEGALPLGSFQVTTDAAGRAVFDQTLSVGTAEPSGITTTATDDVTGSTSEFSYCRPSSSTNLSWVTALPVSGSSSTQQFITDRNQEKWFRVPVQPGSTISVELTGAVGGAVSLHRDPFPIYDQVVNPTTAIALGGAGGDPAFLPSGSLPSGSLPSGSLPSGSLPSGSLPSGSLETGFLPSGSLPSGSLPSGSLPSGSLPSGSLPSGSLPSGSLPSGSLPSGSLPSGSLPSGSLPSGSLPSGSLPSGSLPSGSLPSGSLDGYGTAARRSLMAVSMNPNTAVQTIERNTFDLNENLYIRVVGPFSLSSPFTLEVTVTGGVCAAVSPVTGAAAPTTTNTGRRSVILTDSSRLAGTPTEIATALADLRAFALRSDVDGVVVDLADPAYTRVAAANAQADSIPGCPQAKNIVAEEIKAVIDTYRAAGNPVEYVVLGGSADVIPFHQVQDVAGLANEREYVPPVDPASPTEAGLRSGLVKGQDFYGSSQQLTVGGRTLDLPDLAVGRLVDGAADISTAIAAYIATDGVVVPQSSLVTGYDFVGDGAAVVRDELDAGIGAAPTTLIQPPGEPPTAPSAWTAADLRQPLLSGDHDVVMLTGHFSAGDLLAADYRTTLSAAEIQNAATDYADTIVFALGCHGGFSLPSSDLLADASPDPDWAKAFLRKGVASFIAATGYAYGDTELAEYGERLFIELVQQMRTGAGPVSMGEALVAAKRTYLAETAQLTGVDEKTLVEMTLYGLPMMRIDVLGERLDLPTGTSIVGTPTPVTGGPGQPAGLSSTTTVLNPTVTNVNVPLTDLVNGGTVVTSYSRGRNGVVANPFAPILPQQIDDVTSGGRVLRGVVLRGGSYTDTDGIVPLTSAPTTEVSRPIQSYTTEVFTPNHVWMPNFADAISGGRTRLFTVPEQYRSRTLGSIDGTRRSWNSIELGLYYLPSNWITGTPEIRGVGASAAPTITGAGATVDGQVVTFRVNAVADGSAGVQAVWVLYTGERGSPFHGTWAPLDLVRDPTDPTAWIGTLNIGSANPGAMRFMVQAVGGGGLATLATNLGGFYRVGSDNTPPPSAEPTTVTVSAPTSGAYGTPQTFSATVTAPFGAVAGEVVQFDIGGQQAFGTTNGAGQVSVTITPIVAPGAYVVQASTRGTQLLLGDSDSAPFTLTRETTNLTLTAPSAGVAVGTATGVVATLRDSDGRTLGGKAIEFVATNGVTEVVRVVKANPWGEAELGPVPFPLGTFSVSASFGGTRVVIVDPFFAPSSAGPRNVTYVDATAPTITAAATANGSPYTAGTWTRFDVSVAFTCTDEPGGSGLASCGPNRTITATGVTASVDGTAVDIAGNSTPRSFGPVRIDRTAPTITISSPVAGASFAVGTNVTATYTCTDGESGVASCLGTVASGARLDTATPGTKSFTVNAADSAGNTSTRTVTYTVTGSTNQAPIVAADMGVTGLQEIGYRGNAIVVTGSFADADGAGPYTASIRWSATSSFTPFILSNSRQFAAAWAYPSAGTRVVTVRICDAAGACGTDDITVRVGITQRVTPVRQCVADLGRTRNPRYEARFGYDNPAPFAIYAPAIPFVENTVSPNPAWRGQPQVFLPGSQRDVFRATFNSGTVDWFLHGTTVQARTSSPRC
jgi:hypothetical protein